MHCMLKCNIPGQEELVNVHEEQATPSDGPDSVPVIHCREDKQYPHPSIELHSLQRPIESLRAQVERSI